MRHAQTLPRLKPFTNLHSQEIAHTDSSPSLLVVVIKNSLFPFTSHQCLLQPTTNFKFKTMLVKSSYPPPTFKENRNKIHQMLLTPLTVAWPYIWDISTSTDCWPYPTLMRRSTVRRKSRLLNTTGCLQSARMNYKMTLSHTPELWLSHSQRTSAQAEHSLQSIYVDDPVPSSLQHLMACLLQVPACHKSFMNL